jgi:hypothetical protein
VPRVCPQLRLLHERDLIITLHFDRDGAHCFTYHSPEICIMLVICGLGIALRQAPYLNFELHKVICPRWKGRRRRSIFVHLELVQEAQVNICEKLTSVTLASITGYG